MATFPAISVLTNIGPYLAFFRTETENFSGKQTNCMLKNFDHINRPRSIWVTPKIRGLQFYSLEKKLCPFEHHAQTPKNDVIQKETTATFKGRILFFSPAFAELPKLQKL